MTKDEALAKAVEAACDARYGKNWGFDGDHPDNDPRPYMRREFLAALRAIEPEWKLTNRHPSVEQQTAGLGVRGVGNLALPYALWEVMHDAAESVE